MTIMLNGKPHTLEPGTSIGALLEAVTGASRGSAIVLDGSVVPRSEWDSAVVPEGADVEIVTAVQGG